MNIKTINSFINKCSASGLWWFHIHDYNLDYVGLMIDINKALGCNNLEYAIKIRKAKHIGGYILKRDNWKVCKKYGITVDKVQQALIQHFF